MQYLSLSIAETPIPVPSETPSTSLDTLISFALTVLIAAAVVLALFFLIYGGVLWITSRGDKTKLETARTSIIYSVFGLLVVFLALFIVNFIGNFFHINFIQEKIPRHFTP